MKTYHSRIPHLIVPLRGNRCAIFKANNYTGEGLYSTDDRAEMSLLEQHPLFKRGTIYLDSHVELEPEPDKLEQIETVFTLQDAILWLKDYCKEHEVEYKKCANKFQVHAFAKSLGFEFPSLV